MKIIMENFLFTCCCIFVIYVASCFAVPVKFEKEDHVDRKQAQNKEYYRYVTQVMQELEKDPVYMSKMSNVSDEDIASGKVADLYDLVNDKVRKKIDEVKRLEVEYQRELIRQRKHHMMDKDMTSWNPMHYDNKDTFEKDDFRRLLEKHSKLLEEETKRGHEEFKKYELEKEHKRREALKNMSVAEQTEAERKHNASHHKPHEKIHEPGHKPQLEEVWEKEDGLDPENFDPKTFFNLHDKNGDGYLDQYEVDTIFLHDLDKAYNESDPDTDVKEREEEAVRMREHMMKEMDTDKDGLLSIEEFMSETKEKEFETDDEWTPLIDEDQFTEDELNEYEKSLDNLPDAAKTAPHPDDIEENAGGVRPAK